MTTPSGSVSSAARASVPSSPAPVPTTRTLPPRCGGSSGGLRGIRDQIVGCPSVTRPRGPVCGEEKATSEVVSVLRTHRAWWISPPKHTSTPNPAAASLAATLTASTALAGPSAPGAEAGRIAPVKTIGASASWTTSQSIAVSSSVSVPWVTTTPIPRRAASRARRQICSWSSSVRWALGRLVTVCACSPSWSARLGMLASRPSASRSGRGARLAGHRDRPAGGQDPHLADPRRCVPSRPRGDDSGSLRPAGRR